MPDERNTGNSEFEERLRALLADTAEAIPADADLSARVLQASTQAAHHSRAGGAASAWLQWHGLMTVSAAVVVVALLAGVLAFVHPGGLLRPVGGVNSTPTSTTTATAAPTPTSALVTCPDLPSPPINHATLVDHSVAVGRAASLHGITITIDRAYADASQTVISFHLQTTVNPPMPVLPVLRDAQGRRYEAVGNSWGVDVGGRVLFTPLPPDELGAPQRLTFFTQQMQQSNPTGPGAVVDGPWQISFTLTPVAGTSRALRNAPLTQNGLTIQPVRLDVAPAGGGLDGARGGVRVVVRFSGLAPGMPLENLRNFDFSYDLSSVGGANSCGGAVLALAQPNGQQLAPGSVSVLGQTVPSTLAEQQASPYAQTVGPSGTAEVEAMFYTPMPPGANVTLYIDHVLAQVAGADKAAQISGPWTFQLVPNA